MDDKRNNTRSYRRENPDIPMYEELPPVTRTSWWKKKGEPSFASQPLGSTHAQPSHYPSLSRTSLSHSSRSEHAMLATSFHSSYPTDQNFQDVCHFTVKGIEVCYQTNPLFKIHDLKQLMHSLLKSHIKIKGGFILAFLDIIKFI